MKPHSERVRERYETGELELAKMVEMLERVDPESLRMISKTNKIRVMRALEIYHSTGKKRSDIVQEMWSSEFPFHFHLLHCP